MAKKETKKSIQSIVCEVCNGTGNASEGVVCKNCHGVGGGAFYDDKFFYWGKSLRKDEIKWSHIKNDLQLVVDFIIYILGLAGVLAVIWWLWFFPLSNMFVYESATLGDMIAGYEKLAFWKTQHWLILLFWIGVLADMFILYRLCERKESMGIIKKIKYKKIALNNWDDLRVAIKAKKIVDVSKYYSKEAMMVVEKAFLSSINVQRKISSEDLFLAFLETKLAAIVFSRLNVDLVKVIETVARNLPQESEGNDYIISNNLKEILIEAYINALNNEQLQVDSLNLVMPIILHDEKILEILYDAGIDHDTMLNVVNWYRINDRLMENYRLFVKSASLKPENNMDKAYTAVATPILNHFSSDLTLAAKWGRLDLSVGRDAEIEDIFQAWTSGKFGAVLVGPPGVGKRTIASGIAQLMVKEDVPEIFKDKRLVELDLTRLLSGLTAEAAMERLLIILDEVGRAGNIILYIENIDSLAGITVGMGNGLELSDILSGAISHHQFYCLVTVTEDNYVKCLEGKSLGNSLYNIVVAEPSCNDAINMIESKIGSIESKYKIYFSYGAIRKSVEQSSKYIHDKFLPEKAFDILEAVAVKVVEDRGTESVIDDEDIAIAISELTGIPITKVTADEGKELLELESKMHERMVGQLEAVDMVADSLRRARANMRESKRPIASFLFLGPTGVGKTELAKTISQVYFGREDYMVRLDMSEYQLANSVDKMIGNISGIQGYLTEAVRKLPFSLVLLDEIEKAHPDILNLFLQVIDDGRLTDGQGRTIDFTNCIIIATSNAGAVFIQKQIEQGALIENIKRQLIDEHLVSVMRPELINRFDGVIVFKPLQLTEVAQVARLMLKKTGKMLEEKGINFRVDEVGILKLASSGYDPKYGARPLRRLIQDKIENVIANKILAQEVERRDTIVIDSMAQIKIEKKKSL